MSNDQTLTLSEAVEQVLGQVDGPVAVEELCERVLTLWPSKAKNPQSNIRTHLRQDQAGKTLVFVDADTVLPLPVAMQGVRFRVPLDRREVKRGMAIIRPAFNIFLRREIEPEAVHLLDQRGRSLPVRLMTIQEQVNTPFGTQPTEYAAFDLSDWFRTEGVRRNDSLLVTVEDWTEGHFRLEHEPAKRRRQAEIERRDRELADLLFGMLENSRYEKIATQVAVPTAYARLSDPRGYPGNHWIEVVQRDERMRTDGWNIAYSDWRSPLESIFSEEEGIPEVGFSDVQGRQVYRFKAALWHRAGLWRTVEIQGKQTLAGFDAILRDAFEHDSFDHMSGFWKRVRRGKSKRYREVDVGDINPFGEGSGSEVHIAGLGLEPGDELKYVYDFGDWIKHRITLEKIVEPEAEVKYPRIVAQNKPRYRNCETCLAQGRKTRATWICLECSSFQERTVVLCEECLVREHEDHYAEEILY
jgi:hypothetical protein